MHYIGMALRYLGQTLLFATGTFFIVTIILDMFEGRAGISELSPLEIIFIVALFILGNNHYKKSSQESLSRFRILYLPMRNLGWYFLLTLTLSFFLVGVYDEGEEILHKRIESEAIIFQYSFTNAIQLTNFFIVLLCVYLATPDTLLKKSVLKKGSSGETTG